MSNRDALGALKTPQLIRNKPTPEGRELGAQMAPLCDAAEPDARLVLPEIPPRCASCAFRHGDHLANGSPHTLMDALHCVMEDIPFYCHDHHRPEFPCSGWLFFHLSNKKDAPNV